MSDTLPTAGRLAGIDFGTVRIGVAVSDPGQTIASPLDNYTRRGPALDAAYFTRLVSEERIAGFVIGLPVFASGDEGPKSREARSFGVWLAEQTGRPIHYHDERYTSAMAEELMAQAGLSKKRQKERLDKLAAQLILTAYLEAKAAGNSRTAPAPLHDAERS
jgi:putative Holliday junction resolvase